MKFERNAARVCLTVASPATFVENPLVLIRKLAVRALERVLNRAKALRMPTR